MQTIEKRLLDIRELSKLTGFTVGTLYQWAHQGKIPCVRPNGSKRCLRFDRLAIDAWIQLNSSAYNGEEKKLDMGGSSVR